ncbi:MAG: sel1 repeat family protein, partial [Muribaculaceae bacterium]|nr:sel1 repeat family protein [Muribaculaceae bacterium]
MKQFPSLIFLLGFLFSLLFPILGSAQEFKVKSMVIMPDDLTARTNPRTDLDGDLCALLKIYVKDKITEVQGNAVGEVVDKGIEKWVYVSDHTKSIVLNFYDHFPLKITFDDHKYRTVSEGMTYVIKLVEENDNSMTASTTPSTTTTPATQKPAVVSTPVPSPSTAEILEEAKKCYDSKDYAKAMNLFRKIEGDKEAQYYIGRMYALSEGVSKDKAEAVRWYWKAAEQGHVKAQLFLGTSYENGIGVSMDDQEAAKWYRKAAEQGDDWAQFLIACKYEKGKGVPQDYQEAVRWYRKAAEQDNSIAQFHLGVMYDNGLGVSQDYQEAVRWYRKAAEQGNSIAQFNLGYMYANGQGVPQDYQEAVRWYQKAADQGNAYAQAN